MPATLALAIEHLRAGRLREAEDLCRESSSRDPRDTATLHLLGRALQALGRLAEAREAYRRAIELEPEHAAAHLDLGAVSLLLGDFATGWRALEWRLHVADVRIPAPAKNLPRWDGSDPAGRTILVYGEPDAGDCIQFARYLPLLTGRGADVILTCPRPLVRLFGGMPEVCVVADGDPPPRADACVPIGSLPLVFGTTPATIPTFAAYLRADSRLVAAWRQRLLPLRDGGRRLVGLAGPGLGTLPDDAARLIPSVQCLAMSDYADRLHDLADTAALVAQFDLVITADAPVAHLAGALGRPCWTLLPRLTADWRWGLDGEGSAWYPAMRVFHPQIGAAGDSLANEVAQALKREFPVNASSLAA